MQQPKMTTCGAPEQPAGALDRVFRQHYGRIVAALVRTFGKQHLELAEDAAQEALTKAAQAWPAQGLPEQPAAWLITVARNHALDVLRRDTRFRDRTPEVTAMIEASNQNTPDPIAFEGELSDDELSLMFFCYDPAVARPARAALTLNIVCGFRAEEIAPAFFLSTQAVYQRIHRGKQQLGGAGVAFSIPKPNELPARLDGVLDVLYLMFNEGYSCHDGEQIFRPELTDEAIRLVSMLTRHPVVGAPHVHALHALMLLQSSRLEARLDSQGALVPLPRQDRTQWNHERIAAGLDALARAGEGIAASEIHLLAGVAACHATAESYEATDWRRIVQLYNRLAADKQNFVIDIGRAIALAQLEGPKAGLALLDTLDDSRSEDYHLLAAARAEMLSDSGQASAAQSSFERAAALAPTKAERRHFLQRAMEQNSVEGGD